jgi:SAM-dependent methyltransferase
VMRKTPMTPEEIARRRTEIIARRGPWSTDNILLTRSLYSIDGGAAGQELRVRRIVQTVVDLSGSRLKGRRVLELGSGEGGVALELAKQGAEVVAIESRPALVEKAEFARDALRLEHATIVHGDPRQITPEEHGYFDVVLALGTLDHLDVPAVFDVVKRVGAVCIGLALVEARLAARPSASVSHDGLMIRGARRKGPRGRAASAPVFHLTRPSLLALLARHGFSSIVETLDPQQDPDAPCFAAFKGRRVALVTAPQANAVPPPVWNAASPAKPPTRISTLLGRRRG